MASTDHALPRYQRDVSEQGSRPRATTALADMATNSTDNASRASTDCSDDENTDGDHYFCEDKTGNLAAVFKQIAIESVKRARLIDVD